MNISFDKLGTLNDAEITGEISTELKCYEFASSMSAELHLDNINQ